MAYGPHVLFEGVSAQIGPGETLVVTGANGAGKSTLLKIIAGLARPEEGTVRRTAAFGYAAPDVNLYAELTGHENLRFSPACAGCPTTPDDLLARVGLPRRRGGDLVGAYSSGMRQRLKLAVSLLGDPPLLIWDEPTLALDAAGGERVEEILAGTGRTAGWPSSPPTTPPRPNAGAGKASASTSGAARLAPRRRPDLPQGCPGRAADPLRCRRGRAVRRHYSGRRFRRRQRRGRQVRCQGGAALDHPAVRRPVRPGPRLRARGGGRDGERPAPGGPRDGRIRGQVAVQRGAGPGRGGVSVPLFLVVLPPETVNFRPPVRRSHIGGRGPGRRGDFRGRSDRAGGVRQERLVFHRRLSCPDAAAADGDAGDRGAFDSVRASRPRRRRPEGAGDLRRRDDDRRVCLFEYIWHE